MANAPRNVLVAVDFGEASARAVAIGGLVAERCHAATLRLLHAEAIEAPPYFTSEQIEGLERQRQSLEAQANRFLVDFGRAHTSIPFTSSVDDRPPADAILHASESADLVVMGTHGRHGPRRWWLGSVAERVLRETTRPLLIARADPDPPVAQLFERVVVHAAAPIAGDPTIEYARELAGCFGATPVDARHGLIEPAITRTHATLLVAAVPDPRTAAWTSNYGEPLIRFSTIPILFVPDTTGGASR